MRNALTNLLSRFRKDEDGVTLVEYGIALVLAISVGSLLFTVLADQVKTNINDADTAMAQRNAS